MSMKRARHRAQIRECVTEIDLLLPRLASRHAPLVVLAALTEHMSGSLLKSRESYACSPTEVRAIIARVTELAFPPGEASPS
ncbi:MAG TPA: hypothetical protein VHB68_01980 [Steroidobacteraceae bacterium]|nr:hypothetical protein [Steroidobacteraceae bacterium]